MTPREDAPTPTPSPAPKPETTPESAPYASQSEAANLRLELIRERVSIVSQGLQIFEEWNEEDPTDARDALDMSFLDPAGFYQNNLKLWEAYSGLYTSPSHLDDEDSILKFNQRRDEADNLLENPHSRAIIMNFTLLKKLEAQAIRIENSEFYSKAEDMYHFDDICETLFTTTLTRPDIREIDNNAFTLYYFLDQRWFNEAERELQLDPYSGGLDVHMHPHYITVDDTPFIFIPSSISQEERAQAIKMANWEYQVNLLQDFLKSEPAATLEEMKDMFFPNEGEPDYDTTFTGYLNEEDQANYLFDLLDEFQLIIAQEFAEAEGHLTKDEPSSDTTIVWPGLNWKLQALKAQFFSLAANFESKQAEQSFETLKNHTQTFFQLATTQIKHLNHAIKLAAGLGQEAQTELRALVLTLPPSEYATLRQYLAWRYSEAKVQAIENRLG